MCVMRFMCVHMYACACVWKPGVNLSYSSLATVYSGVLAFVLSHVTQADLELTTYLAKDDLKLVSLMFLPYYCWDCRYTTSHHLYSLLGINALPKQALY